MPFAALGVARLADVIGMRRELLYAAAAYAICGMLLMPMLRRTDRETQPDAAQHLAAIGRERGGGSLTALPIVET
jgi:hypothetical protein